METQSIPKEKTSMPTDFERCAANAKTSKDFAPVWREFFCTAFFVVVPQKDAGILTTLSGLSIHESKQNADEKSIVISEYREHLPKKSDADNAIKVSGATLLGMLDDGLAIIIVMTGQNLRVPPATAQKLKKSLQKAESGSSFPEIRVPEVRVAQTPAAVSPAPQEESSAPATAQVHLLQPVSAPYTGTATPSTTPQSIAAQRILTDAAKLEPRSVTNDYLGVDFYVPRDWEEKNNDRSIKLVDPVSKTRLEVGGLQRENISLDKWTSMRLPLVESDMPYMHPSGDLYPLQGDGWRDRIHAQIAEFKGTVPGEEEESTMFVCCMRTDEMLVAFTLIAKTTVFDQHRAMYKWLLTHVDIAPKLSARVNAPAHGATGSHGPQGAYGSHDTRHMDNARDARIVYAATSHTGVTYDDTFTPPPFGMSTTGRIGRMRYLAYNWPVYAVIALIGIAAAILMPRHGALALVIMVPAFVVMAWMVIRLMVLRLHDLNLSGKWLLAPFALFGICIVGKMVMLAIIAVALLIVGHLAMLVWPGADDGNNYGPPPGPNTTLVNVGAGICILLMVLGAIGDNKMARSGMSPFGSAPGQGQVQPNGDMSDYPQHFGGQNTSEQ